MTGALFFPSLYNHHYPSSYVSFCLTQRLLERKERKKKSKPHTPTQASTLLFSKKKKDTPQCQAATLFQDLCSPNTHRHPCALTRCSHGQLPELFCSPGQWSSECSYSRTMIINRLMCMRCPLCDDVCLSTHGAGSANHVGLPQPFPPQDPA